MRAAVDVLLQILFDEGVTHIFGNPGSTELALMEALDGSGLRYVLGLQEAAVVGMADGFAQASGRAGVVSLHAVGGLGNGIGAIAGARLTRAPLVVFAGNQDRRHLARDAWLSGDLAAMAAPVVKSSHQVTRAGDLPLLVRRAFRDALSPPRGPICLSIPMDVLQEPIAEGPGRKSFVDYGGVPASTRDLGERIAAVPSDRVALIFGDEVWQTSGGDEAALRLAEASGAAVFGAPLSIGCVFPPAHPQWRGQLAPETQAVRSALKDFDMVLGVGGRLLHAYPWNEGAFLPAHVGFAHLSGEVDAPGRTETVDTGLVGSIAATLDALTDAFRGKLARRRIAVPGSVEGCLLPGRSPTPTGLHASSAVVEILRAMPKDTPLVNEACCAFGPVREHMAMRTGQYFFIGAGQLGWAMPAAVGVSLARGRVPVVCLVGDGGAMYAPQALWSARREGAPVVFVVLDNGEYGILKQQARLQGLTKARAGQFLAMDLDPPLDFCSLASSMNVKSARVTCRNDLGDAVRLALRREEASLIHVALERMPSE